MTDAIVLSGGVARGAFEAGALKIILERVPNLDIKTIVGASAGSLNAAFLASAVRNDQLKTAGDKLESIWRDQATLGRGFDLNLFDVFSGKGISDNANLLATIRKDIFPSKGTRPIDLKMLVTTSVGEVKTSDGYTGTTFEHVCRFDGTAFDTQAGVDEVLTTATASSAIPFIYSPVPLTVSGLKQDVMDGGISNNTPIKYAIEDSTIDRVFVITPFPKDAQATANANLKGRALLEHLADVVTNERLYRDLRRAHHVNAQLKALATAFAADPAGHGKALTALGWSGKRPLTIVQVCPELPLPGGAFSAFTNLDLRQQYIRSGEEAAKKAVL